MPAPPIIVGAGVSAASFGAPTEFVSPAKPPAILADNIDPATGEFVSILSGIHPVDSHVITALRTERGSGVSVMATGQRFRDVRKVDDAFARRIQDECEIALAHLIERRDIMVPKIAVVEDGDTGHLYFVYANLRAQNRRKRKPDGSESDYDYTKIMLNPPSAGVT
jgi:hypothetical protein